MRQNKVLEDFIRIDKQLREVTLSFGKTNFDIAEVFQKLPPDMREKVRPLLMQQLRNLDTLRRERFSHLNNVSVLPMFRSKGLIWKS